MYQNAEEEQVKIEFVLFLFFLAEDPPPPTHTHTHFLLLLCFEAVRRFLFGSRVITFLNSSMPGRALDSLQRPGEKIQRITVEGYHGFAQLPCVCVCVCVCERERERERERRRAGLGMRFGELGTQDVCGLL